MKQITVDLLRVLVAESSRPTILVPRVVDAADRSAHAVGSRQLPCVTSGCLTEPLVFGLLWPAAKSAYRGKGH